MGEIFLDNVLKSIFQLGFILFVTFNKVEIKEKILKAAREKGRVTHKGKPIRLTADLSAETSRKRVGANIQHP